MTGSLTALEMLRNGRFLALGAAQGQPRREDTAGPMPPVGGRPPMPGGNAPDLPGALLTGLLTPRTLGMENAQLPPATP